MSMAAEAVSSSISVIPGLPASVEILGWARARYVFQALADWLMSEPAKQLPPGSLRQNAWAFSPRSIPRPAR